MIGIQGETTLDEVTKSPADAALSTTSTNSVQNKVVTEEINELKDSLNANVYGTTVDITSYIDGIYTFPSDGYVRLRADTDGTKTIALIGNVLGAGSNNTPIATITVESKAQSRGDRWASLYVKKGMRFSCHIISGTSSMAKAYFVSLIN